MKKIYVLFLVLLLASCQSVAAYDLNNELALAVQQGDIEKVKALIVSGADVNSRSDLSYSWRDHTPLMYAVYGGD